MEVGHLEYPGASTVGSRPLDWNNARMTGATAQPTAMSPHTKGEEQAPDTLENTSGEKKNTNNNNKALGEEGGKKMAKRTSWAKKT